MNAELITRLDRVVDSLRGAGMLFASDRTIFADLRKALVDADSQFMRGHTKGVEDGMAAAERHFFIKSQSRGLEPDDF